MSQLTPSDSHVIQVVRPRTSLFSSDFGGGGGTSLLQKILDPMSKGFSSQAISPGVKEHPLNFSSVKALSLANEHHAICIRTFCACVAGLGFDSPEAAKERADKQAQKAGIVPVPGGGAALDIQYKESKVDTALDPLTIDSFQAVLSAMVEDYGETGNGYVEVVRDFSSGAPQDARIVGVHHLPTALVKVNVENAANAMCYEISGGNESGTPRIFANFGDLDGFFTRHSNLRPDLNNPNLRVSEVIHFKCPTSHHRWYGLPRWLSAIPAIELLSCLKQYKYDFFNNRGVPELMLFVTGQKLDSKEWETLTSAINANIGLGNAHKTSAFNFTNPNIKIQVEKLVGDANMNDSLDATNETYQVAIVTAHGVPPLLAGILIPGKLGSNNELPNSLMAYQALRVGPDQRVISRKFAQTLGNKLLNGGLSLTEQDFVFRKVTDEIDLSVMDTTSRMRQTLPEAQAAGRDVANGGLKK